MQFSFDRDVDAVYQLFINPEIYIERCEAMGEKNIVCDTHTEAGKTTQKVSRTVTSDLPKALAKLAGSENTITSDVVWTDEGEGAPKTGQYNAEIVGSPIPVKIQATFSLQPKGSGCTYIIDTEVETKKGMIGKIAKKFAAKEVEETQPKEHAWNVKKLASM